MFRKPGQVLTLYMLTFALHTHLRAEQNPAQVLIERARTLDAQGRHDLAAENWQQVLLIEPRQPDGLAALVRYYRESGDTARAQQYEKRLARVRPGAVTSTTPIGVSGENANAMLLEAGRLAAAHNYAESLKLYQKVFGSSQPPDNWAVAYYETEAAIPSTQPHAVAGLRTLAQKYPANPSYQLALGQVLTYRPSTRLDGMRLLAKFQGSPEQDEQARTAWKQALIWEGNSAAGVELARQYLEKYADADLNARITAATSHASAVKTAAAPAEEGQGYHALASGDLELATEKFTRLVNETRYSSQGEAGLGFVAMRRKDFGSAVAHFEQARAGGLRSVELDKALKESRYWEAMTNGNSALAARNPDRAAEEFARARKVDSARPEATEALAGSLLADNDSEQAEAVFAQELKGNPHRADAWIGWMSSALESGKASEVLARQTAIPGDVKVLLAKRPDYIALLASANLALGNSADATRLLDRISSTNSPNSQSATAQVRAAGILLKRGYSDQAAKLSISAIKADRENPEAWEALIEAQHVSGRDENAMRFANEMPPSVGAAAMQNADFLLSLAAIYQGQKRFDTASTLLDRAAKLKVGQGGDPSAVELQTASLAMAQGDPHKAYALYRSIEERDTQNSEAWSGMVSALHAGKHDPEALATIEQLPPAVTERLRQDIEFLQMAGFVYSANGRGREAILCLRAVSNSYRQEQKPVPFAVDTQYAWLLLNAGDEAQLAATLNQIAVRPHLTSEQTRSVQQIWAAWSIRRAEAGLRSGAPKTAIAILQTAARAYPERPELVSALASMYVRTGTPNLALNIYVQMSWAQASVEQFRAAIEAAVAAHNRSYADSWLQLGLRQHPNDPSLLRLAASLEEERGHHKKAEAYLQAASGTPGNTGQLRPDITTLLALGTKPELEAEPLASDADASPEIQLAHMLGAGRVPVSDSNERTDTWSTAKPDTSADIQNSTAAVLKPLAYEVPETRSSDADRSSPSEDPAPDSTKVSGAPHAEWPGDAPSARQPGPNPTRQAGRDTGSFALERPASPPSFEDLLKESDALTTPGAPLPPSSVGSSERGSGASLHEILNGTGPKPRTGFTDGLETEPTPHPAGLELALTPGAGRAVSIEPVVSVAQQRAADDLSELESRYSPWLATGGALRSHSGTKGFDQLLENQLEIESSTVLGGGARITAIGRPVLLQSGVPDSTSNYRFGTGSSLPQTTQFASGFGVEVQMATRVLQASAGLSPTNFLVSNGIGSIALRPAQGPVTFRAYRSPVKDSLLSYAGSKDPDTGLVWGGVVADGGAIELSHGGAESGFYASVDGQRLTGRNVADNTRIMGNAGAYWLAYSNPFGQLKVGANLTAMHYALNERYFTFGQGGYFSPNAFIMANAPLTWESRPMYQTYYQISGSIGAQNIQQGQALAGSLIAGDGVETITSASYDLHARVVYRATEHWNLEGFFDTNNARQYTERSAGFTLRYIRSPQPVEYVPNGFLNQTDIRPLVRP